MVPNKGEQNQKWLPHPCLLGGPEEGYGTPAFLGIPNKGEQNEKRLPHPLFLFFFGSRSRIKINLAFSLKKKA